MLCFPVDIALEGRDFTGDVLPFKRFAFSASATPCFHSYALNVTTQQYSNNESTIDLGNVFSSPHRRQFQVCFLPP
jgi:hypothetical protein